MTHRNRNHKQIKYDWTGYENNLGKITIRRITTEDFCDVATQWDAEQLIKRLEAMDIAEAINKGT